MEIVIVGDKNTEWYGRCRLYLDNKKAQKETIKMFCEGQGIDKSDWKADADNLFVRANEKYEHLKPQSKKDFYYDNDGKYYRIKKNSKLGKEFLGLELKHTYKPMVNLDLLDNGLRPIRYCQFVHNEKVYIRIESDNEIKVPQGFTVMKLGDYFNMLDDIKDKSNDLFLENV